MEKKTKLERMMVLNNFFAFILVFCAHNAFAARSLESAAKGLEKKSSDLALMIAPLGFLIAGAYMAFGKEEGKQKVGLAILGVVCIVGAVPFIQWIKSMF